MADGEDRRRTVGQHDLLHEGLEVVLVFREIADMAFARIAELALGAALPAPIKRGNRKAARAQLAHGLEIFLDEFGAALEQADRALAAGRRMPTREAQADAVAGLDCAGNDIVRHRIGWDRDEIHENFKSLASSARSLAPYSSRAGRLN
jgi:hypothetical protein